MAPFERLVAWQVAHQLALRVYSLTKAYPKDELYGLVSQSRRAAVSVAANLVEGAARRGGREMRRFVDMSRSSLEELRYLTRLSRDLGYLAEADTSEVTTLINRTGYLTYRLQQRLVAKNVS